MILNLNCILGIICCGYSVTFSLTQRSNEKEPSDLVCNSCDSALAYDIDSPEDLGRFI